MRTDITNQTTFPMTKTPATSVTYTFDSDSSRPNITRITLPPGSKWTSSLHWHERYTEYIRVLNGRINLTLNGKTRTVSSEDGPQVVEKFVVHEWMRADRNSGSDDQEVVVEEWTDPADTLKQIFFRNLLGTKIDFDNRNHTNNQQRREPRQQQRPGYFDSLWRGWLMTLQIRLICATYDNFEVLEGLPSMLASMEFSWVGWCCTHLVYGVSRLVGWVGGLKSWYIEYTPERLRGLAEEKGRTRF